MQSDPIGLAGGVNTYAYAESNALSLSDPLGLQAQALSVLCGPAWWLCAGAATAATAIGVQGTVNALNKSSSASGSSAESCPPNNCPQLEAEIKQIAMEVRERYFAMLNDYRDLYNSATITPVSRRGGTWAGHRQQFRDKQKQLANKIAQADQQGCKVDQMDRLLANSGEPPSSPAAR